jgi:hypothetical protein
VKHKEGGLQSFFNNPKKPYKPWLKAVRTISINGSDTKLKSSNMDMIIALFYILNYVPQVLQCLTKEHGTEYTRKIFKVLS